jgi:hypothetical protein
VVQSGSFIRLDEFTGAALVAALRLWSGSFFRFDKPWFGLQSFAQVKLNPLQFVQVKAGKVVQSGGSQPGKPHAHEAAVAAALIFADQTFLASPLHQSYHSVVAFLQELRQLTNGGPSAAGVSRNAQKQDVLLGRQAVLARGPFAETKKEAEVVAEPGKTTEQKGIR